MRQPKKWKLVWEHDTPDHHLFAAKHVPTGIICETLMPPLGAEISEDCSGVTRSYCHCDLSLTVSCETFAGAVEVALREGVLSRKQARLYLEE